MNVDSLTRFVMDEDPEVIPGKQVWIDRDGKVWHDLHFVHTSMFARSLEKEWREWRADFILYARRMGVSADRFHLRGQCSSLDAFRVWSISDPSLFSQLSGMPLR